MVQQFRNHILEDFQELIDAKILLAISGGLDSVCLAYLAHQAGLNISLAHCNFNLRDEESQGDQDFVYALSQELEVPLFVEGFDTEKYSKKHKCSIQIAARELRYAYFESLRKTEGFDYLMTAHHLDDSLETFVINLSRGTGLNGLLGIPSKQNWIRRPFLIFTRKEILNFALENEIQWREDSSNASDKYVRNKIRHQIIPKLKELNPSLEKSFRATLEHLKHSQELALNRLEQLKSLYFQAHPNHDDVQIINIKNLIKEPNAEANLYGLFEPYGFNNTFDLLNLSTAQSGKFLENQNYRLLKDRNSLLLETKGYIDIRPEIQQLSEKNEEFDYSIKIAKDLLNTPLVVRKWKDGDYFYPEGFHGKKKLSAYFRDEKLSIIDKERTWILSHGEDVVAIIGKRNDKRYLEPSKTNEYIQIAFKLK